MAGPLPSTPHEWEDKVRDLRLEDTTIHTLTTMRSGSKVTMEQYLMLRVLRTEYNAKNFHPREWALDGDIGTARHQLAQFNNFQDFLNSVRLDAGPTHHGAFDPHPLGIFEIPREAHRCIQDIGERTSSQVTFGQGSAVPTLDEESVNLAAITFAQAVCLKMRNVFTRWIPVKYAFRPNFRANSFEARVVGPLAVWGEPERIQALVECKAKQRSRRNNQVRMQETAQIVG